MPVENEEYESSNQDVARETPAVQQPGEKQECRDFKKGDCRRGARCIYYHPKLDICRDFASRKCERPNCRFMHISREEEEIYANSGILPERVKNGDTTRNSGMVGDFNMMPGLSHVQSPYGQQQNNAFPEPMCRDFEKGDCRRGARCKFFHPKLKICRDFQKEKCDREKCKFLHMSRAEEETYEGNGILPDHIDKEEAKKKRVMTPQSGGDAANAAEMYGAKRRRDDSFDSMPGQANIGFAAVLQENETLKLKITEMQQQINDLRKMNDTLYEQNNKYRFQTNAAVGGMQIHG